MPDYIVRTENTTSAGEATYEGLQRPEDALAYGVSSAADILADEVGKGLKASAVEVSVEDLSGKRLCRVVVSLSIAPLAMT